MNTAQVSAAVPRLVPVPPLELLGRGFVQAYNDRDVEAMVALTHPEVVGNPSRPLGGGTYQGHAGLRNWWRSMAARGSWYEIAVSGIQQVERRLDDRRGGAGQDVSDHGAVHSGAGSATEHRVNDRRQVTAQKLAMFGDICMDGESLGPWAAVLIVQDGLIIRQRSYLSTRSLLEEIGIVSEPPRLARAAAEAGRAATDVTALLMRTRPLAAARTASASSSSARSFNT